MPTPYPAELYAKLHLGNPGDLAFYREQCRGAETILELGCGYGRVLEALSDDNHRLVVGLDMNRGLLELAQRRLREATVAPPELVRGDMRRFAFGRKFDRILIPYSAIYCLLSIADLHACLSKIAEHLNPEGLLLFDAYSADAFHHEAANEENQGAEDDSASDEADEVACIDHEGTTYHVVERSDWSREDQRLDVVYLHEPRQGGPSIATRLEHRYLLSEQIEPLLEAAGLQLISLAGDYIGTQITDDSEIIVATAKLR
ncbi:MAG: class I SAM-dependent methyltransferase [Deltaproteobacteria bacterium]|nr:class I SAM-dependent methyltransferase [Deltaproteobacteria bacterium]MBW2722979.1 class I SAM-dependent methyltransferase [Deltaproteobacteria bacterium]